jgi:hypothetical protein
MDHVLEKYGECFMDWKNLHKSDTLRKELKDFAKGLLFVVIALVAAIIVPPKASAIINHDTSNVTVTRESHNYNHDAGYHQGWYIGNDENNEYNDYYRERNERLGLTWLCDTDGHHCYWATQNGSRD